MLVFCTQSEINKKNFALTYAFKIKPICLAAICFGHRFLGRLSALDFMSSYFDFVEVVDGLGVGGSNIS